MTVVQVYAPTEDSSLMIKDERDVFGVWDNLMVCWVT